MKTFLCFIFQFFLCVASVFLVGISAQAGGDVELMELDQPIQLAPDLSSLRASMVKEIQIIALEVNSFYSKNSFNSKTIDEYKNSIIAWNDHARSVDFSLSLDQVSTVISALLTVNRWVEIKYSPDLIEKIYKCVFYYFDKMTLPFFLQAIHLFTNEGTCPDSFLLALREKFLNRLRSLTQEFGELRDHEIYSFLHVFPELDASHRQESLIFYEINWMPIFELLSPDLLVKVMTPFMIQKIKPSRLFVRIWLSQVQQKMAFYSHSQLVSILTTLNRFEFPPGYSFIKDWVYFTSPLIRMFSPGELCVTLSNLARFSIVPGKDFLRQWFIRTSETFPHFSPQIILEMLFAFSKLHITPERPFLMAWFHMMEENSGTYSCRGLFNAFQALKSLGICDEKIVAPVLFEVSSKKISNFNPEELYSFMINLDRLAIAVPRTFLFAYQNRVQSQAPFFRLEQVQQVSIVIKKLLDLNSSDEPTNSFESGSIEEEKERCCGQ